MSRSLRKGPCIQEALEKRVLAMNEGTMKKEVIKTWSRASMISPDFVGNFSKKELITRRFESKHYWFPLPDKDIYLYEGFPQNPGW